MTLMVGSLLSIAGLVCLSLLDPPPRRGRKRIRSTDPVARLGALIRKHTGEWLPSLDAVQERVVGSSAILGVVMGGFILPLTPIPLLVVAAVGITRTRTDRVRYRTTIDGGMVQLVDLLSLAVAAGLSLRRAFAAVAPRLPREHGILVEALLERVQHGERLVTALQQYGDELGRSGHELVAILIASERDGAPLAGGLERAADAVRRAQRRDLERRARRLPVTLLVPLVCCVLPAFVVLTVVPLLAGSLGDLRFPT